MPHLGQDRAHLSDGSLDIGAEHQATHATVLPDDVAENARGVLRVADGQGGVRVTPSIHAISARAKFGTWVRNATFLLVGGPRAAYAFIHAALQALSGFERRRHRRRQVGKPSTLTTASIPTSTDHPV
ncbi:hypothetical protein [Nocardia aurantiaca]|uniref:Uncharacterized protein n=1 Tax=Nocardia aurantiaca TaxID=2675850 RepID=A0A6I3KYM8_9NOCA|nr:hypothetical protein [Nocardia aurantiaca]MTE15182.1 hypothetical protein [Nocardia aurantiaca]